MRRLLLSFILICLLTIPASAHPGRTDSSGGHYNRSTGDYHYHHGYSAHDHYDMDGDGDLDCPYNFDDQTDRSSGTASSAYSPPSSTESDYRRGYENGKADGYDDGFNDGKTFGQTAAEKRGYDKGHTDGYSSGYSKARLLGFAGIAVTVVFFWLYLRWKNQNLEYLRDEYADKLWDKKQELQAVKAERDKLLAQQKSIRADCQAQITQATTACQRQIQENTYLCDARIKQIEKVARQQIQDCFLECFDPQRKSSLQFPPDIDFHKRGISRGTRTPERPFGDLTVYRTPSGKCFHTVRGCCGATDPVCVYEERLRYVYGCSKCTDYRYAYKEVPDWYKEYKLLLSGAYMRKAGGSYSVRPDTEPKIKVGRDQQLRIEMGAADVPKPTPRERPNDLDVPMWQSIQDGMERTRITDKYISIEDLEYAGISWFVDIKTALKILNEERTRNSLPPFEIREDCLPTTAVYNGNLDTDPIDADDFPE